MLLIWVFCRAQIYSVRYQVCENLSYQFCFNLTVIYFFTVRWIKDHGEETSLPDLPYSPRQLFFISFGQVWCSKYRDQALKRLIKTNSHAPGQFRVLGTLQNNEDFAKEFNCPLGSKMNPEKKCTVW